MPYIQDYIRASPVVEPLEMFTKSVLVTQAQLTLVKKTALKPLGR